METIWTWGTGLIVSLQTAAGLAPVMTFLSFLGREEFFLLLMPALYWAWDARLGRRLGALLVFSAMLNDLLRFAFGQPRPYWTDSRITVLAPEPTYGVPSAHAQVGTAIWGFLAHNAPRARRSLAFILAGALVVLISLSRVYFGAHFPAQVAAGWVVGAAVLWAFVRWEAPITAWLARLNLGPQIGLSFVVSLLGLALALGVLAATGGAPDPPEWAANATRTSAPDQEILPFNPRGLDMPVAEAGLVFGMGAGLACALRWARFSAQGPWAKRGIRYLLGLIGVLVFWRGLALVFPTEPLALAMTFRYLRYALTIFWMLFGAPWVFLKLRLADAQ